MVVPQLPYELWMEIVENATHIPGELDYHTYDPFQSPPARCLEEAVAQVLPTRYSFTLVSRFFHRVALPILYQTLLISDCNQLWNIMRCLDANTTRSRMSSNVQEHALLVKRIHLAAYGEGRWPKSFAKPIPGTFEFSNLTIVSGNGNRLHFSEFGEFLRKDLLTRCSAARSIDGTWYQMNINHCLHFLRSHKNLRSLCYPPSDSRTIPNTLKDSVSRIETLAIANYWPFADLPLTALSSLCAVRLINFQASNLRYVEALGERLTFLDVTSLAFLQINLEMFPNLRTLINCAGSEAHAQCIASSPHFGLVRVAFGDQSIISRRRFRRGIMDFIDNSLLPRLKQMRLIDIRVCRRFAHQNPVHVKRWVDQGLDQGIRLEAGDGRLLSDLIC